MSAAADPVPTAVPGLRRRRRLVALLGALTLAGTVALAACSTPAPDRAELVESFELSGMSKTESACVADAITGTLTTKEIESLAERGGGGAPYDDPAKTDDSADKVREALYACRDAATAAGESTTAPPPETTVPATTAPVSITTNPESIDTTAPGGSSTPDAGSGSSASSTTVAG